MVVIASYKNSQWYERNLASVIAQDYENFRVIYVDDCSPDSTGDLVESFIKKYNQQDRIKLIKNTVRIGAMENLYNSIHSCEDDEIIITLDGDDWLAHSGVLRKINEVYSDSEILMSYGQYRSWPDNGIGCSRQIPEAIINNNSYRGYGWCSSHLRSFYAHLFKKIKREDFIINGKFFSMAWDLAMMFPMLEMAGHKAKFISDVLYIYNVANPINDSKVNLQLQQNLEHIIRSKSRYARL